MVKAPLEVELRSVLARKGGRGKVMAAYFNMYDDRGLFERMTSCTNAHDLPDVVSFMGFGPLFSTGFRERFVDRAVFTSLTFPQVDEGLARRGFIDPKRRYTVLAINPMVMAADHTRLDGRPVPTRWADILRPEFERSVGAVGRGTSLNETLLLSLFKQFGRAGVERFGRAVAWAGHPAEMVTVAGRGLKQAPAVSIIDYFFAKMIKHQERVSIVWPDEGALAIPFVALAKAGKPGGLEEIGAFLTGKTFARICADAYFLPVRAGVPARLPGSLRLNWLGWDFLRGNDLDGLMEEIRTAFLSSFMKGRQ
jgi:ABC-type Fe3+ transport system substrate-binding protein